MTDTRLRVLLAQLPVPPPGAQPIRGNVPLAAGYLKLFARRQGLDEAFDIEILPPALANTLGDQALVEAILLRRPWLVGFSCYVWNIERSLWIGERLKRSRPDLVVVLGGPEIACDNGWVLAHPAVDYAVIGEGEQTFAELLQALRDHPGQGEGHPAALPAVAAAGLWTGGCCRPPEPRPSLESLDEISSPYLEGILDVAEEQALFLETVRGCAFRCKFCSYPKNYDRLCLLSPEKIAANLRHAAERGAKEIVLLDPTLNRRPDFAEFLKLLARHNPDRQWTCFGELRAEGIDASTARLLGEANFTEVEIGLQSLDRRAQDLMGRKVRLAAFERGAKAMLDAGIKVRVDLILGLPGDTPDSVRRSLEYLHQSKLYSEVQVFNLSVLPGTAFRGESQQLGLIYQPRPPYYVLETPSLGLDEICELMDEAQEAFQLEFDPLAPPRPEPIVDREGMVRVARVDLDGEADGLPPPERRAQAFTLALRSGDFDRQRARAAELIRRVVDDNPYTSLDVLLEPVGDPSHLTLRALAGLLEACFSSSSYLDLYYSMQPNRLLGAKRLVAVLPLQSREQLPPAWIEQAGEFATLAWFDSSSRADRTDLVFGSEHIALGPEQ